MRMMSVLIYDSESLRVYSAVNCVNRVTEKKKKNSKNSVAVHICPESIVCSYLNNVFIYIPREDRIRQTNKMGDCE